MFSCKSLTNVVRGTFFSGGSGVTTSAVATAAGAGILGTSVASAVSMAAAGNALILSLIGAGLGYFDKDHHFRTAPTNFADLAFWGKTVAFLGTKAIAAAVGNAMMNGGEEGISAGKSAAADIIGTIVVGAPSALLAYGIFRCKQACANKGFGVAAPARSRRLKGMTIG